MPKPVRQKPEARKFWKEHVQRLEELDRLCPEYRSVFTRLCLVHARIIEYEDQIARDGAILEGPRGGRAKHPLLTPLRQAEQTFNELADKFGLDPKSALRLPKPQLPQRSLREELMGWQRLDQDK